MTDTTAAPSVSDADLLQVLTAREAARLMVKHARESGLNSFHFAHAMLAEGIALAFGGEIEAARIAALAFITGFVNAAVKADTSAAPPAEQPRDNIIKLDRRDQ